jgi:glucose-1-phosphate adenylyltransferase
MGNYIFNRGVLTRILIEDADRNTEHDFGKTILPQLFSSARVFAYNFLENELPGCKEYEERGYWRDVGSIEAYWEAHMDLLGDEPHFDLNNLQWPLMTREYAGPPAKIIRGEVQDSILGEGCVVKGGTVIRSVLGRGVLVEENSLIKDSIVMDFCRIGKEAQAQKTVMDRYNIVKERDEIGCQRKSDRERFYLTSSGIVVIPRGKTRQL